MNGQHQLTVNHGCGPARSYLATLRSGVVIPGAEDSATGLPWYVVHTKLRQEQPACDNLVRQGDAVYLPRMKVLKRSRGRHRARLEPLFPRYFFVQPGSHAHSLAAGALHAGCDYHRAFWSGSRRTAAGNHQSIREFEGRQNEARDEDISPFRSGERVRVASLTDNLCCEAGALGRDYSGEVINVQ